MLCRLLFYNDCQSANFLSLLNVTLLLRDPTDKRRNSPLPEALQRSLIMPFSILKDLHDLKVEGLYSKAVEKDLRIAPRKPNPSAAEYLERAAVLKDEGNAAFKEKAYEASIEAFIKAYEAMQVIVEGKRFAIMLDGWFATTPLVGGRFDGKRGDLTRNRLGCQLSWNLIQAYLKINNFEQAYMWAERAISEIEYSNNQQQIWDGTPQLITNPEKAKVYYRMTQACKGLHKPQWEIRNNLFKALTYAPNDSAIKKECSRA